MAREGGAPLQATRKVSTRTRKKTARHISLIQASAESFPNFSDLTGTVRRVQIVGNRICGSKNTVLTDNKLQLQYATATARADVYLARKLTAETRNRLAEACWGCRRSPRNTRNRKTKRGADSSHAMWVQKAPRALNTHLGGRGATTIWITQTAGSPHPCPQAK